MLAQLREGKAWLQQAVCPTLFQEWGCILSPRKPLLNNNFSSKHINAGTSASEAWVVGPEGAKGGSMK